MSAAGLLPLSLSLNLNLSLTLADLYKVYSGREGGREGGWAGGRGEMQKLSLGAMKLQGGAISLSLSLRWALTSVLPLRAYSTCMSSESRWSTSPRLLTTCTRLLLLLLLLGSVMLMLMLSLCLCL